MISKPETIHAGTIGEAWRRGAELLVNHGDRFNLVVHVEEPTTSDDSEFRSADPKLVASDVKSVFDVANTIFPRSRTMPNASPSEFFKHYSRIYKRGKRRTPAAWGTYFQRLGQFGEDGPSQIEKIIDCMNNWKSKPRAAFVLHLSGMHLDNPRPLGAPCWQYGQFIRTDADMLSLSVVYRSHDYFEKALGNFLGLSRLLKFVCNHTNQTPGSLTCLSTYAHLGGNKAKTAELLRIAQ